MKPMRADKRPPRTAATPGVQPDARNASTVAVTEEAPEISPELVAEISEKVYRLFLEDLRIARERGFRNRQA